MPERVVERPVNDLIDEIDRKLAEFKVDYAGLELRQKVLRLVDIGYATRCLNVNVVHDHGYSITAAKDRLRTYFTEHVGVVLDGAELEVVSGISEYARRVRELRVEEGYRILTGTSPDAEFSDLDLRPDQYVLASADRDISAARRWHVANRIRNGRGSARSRILNYLLENVGEVVTTEELAHVSKGRKEFARRVRELRTEKGYAIATKITGRPDLGIGEYVLLSEDRIAVPHDRRIPIGVQRQVYERDNNACRACGWTVDRYSIEDPRILEIHHIEAHVEGGANLPENLLVLCSRCHDRVHAGDLDIDHVI